MVIWYTIAIHFTLEEDVMSTVKINATVNAEKKEAAQELLKDMGITMSGAIDMLFAQIVANRGMPFVSTLAPVYDEELLEIASEIKAGRNIVTRSPIEV
jgi:addiction module RelB/DinJ family antitoxin